MNTPFRSPKLNLSAFNCPFCGAFAKHNWTFGSKMAQLHNQAYTFNFSPSLYIPNCRIAKCSNCQQHSF